MTSRDGPRHTGRNRQSRCVTRSELALVWSATRQEESVAQVDFAVSDKAPFGLFLRTRPDSSTSSTKKALLPMGQRVNKLHDSEVPDWWEVSTALAGEALQGFVKSTFLT